ncbi:phage tail tape measure protein [Lysobacter sp. GCM10012299]|uniref:phage tail tape measure protein n=1 Tax=Lysobacter sp. GCM10012299 TaxID=3317333 RepID=UPI003605B618
MAFTINYIYKATDKFTAPLAKMVKEVDRMTARMGASMNRVSASMMGVDKAAGRARSGVSALGKVNSQLQGMALNAERYAAAMRKVGSVRMANLPRIFAPGRGRAGGRDAALEGLAAGGSALGIGAALNAGARAAMNLETEMTNVKRLADLTDASLASWKKRVAAMSPHLAKSQAELHAMAANALSAGVELGEMADFLDFAAKGAVAAEFASADEAGSVFGTIKAQLGHDMAAMRMLGDQVNAMADKTNTSNQKMYDILQRSAGSLRSYSTEVQAATAGFFSNLEPDSAVAATALNSMLLKLKLMKGSFGALMRKDAVAGLTKFAQIVKKLPEGKQLQVLKKVFGTEHADTAQKMVQRIDELQAALITVSDPSVVGGLGREYETQMRTMAGSTQKFRAQWENLKATVFDKGVGKGFIDSLTTAVEKINAFADANPKLTQFITIAASATAAALALAGGIAMVNLMLAPLAGVGLVVAGTVAAIGAAILAAWVYCEPFREQLSGLATDFGLTSGAADTLFTAVGYLFEFIGKMVGTVLATAIFTVRQFLNTLGAIGEIIWAVITGRWSEIDDIYNARDQKSREMSQQFDQSMMKSWTKWGGDSDHAGSGTPIYLVKGGQEQLVSGSPVDRAEAARQQLVTAGGAAAYNLPTYSAGTPGATPAMLPPPPSQIEVVVRAEPGTSATVNKANLATGTNVRTQK